MHALHAFVFKKDTIDMTNVPHVEHEGLCIVPLTDKLLAALGTPKMLMPTLVEMVKTFAEINTDYFGGPGEQHAKLYIDGQEEYISEPDHPINVALQKLGVVKSNGNDEFDTIHLGRYRTAGDIIEEWDEKNPAPKVEKSALEIERRFLLKTLPSVIKDQIFNGVRGKKITQCYVEEPDGTRARIRRVSVSTGGCTFFHTVKKYISPGVCQEDEKEISEAEYSSYVGKIKSAIYKTRYEYKDNATGLVWEVDDFKSMVIAEVELEDIEQKVIIPESIQDEVVIEITGMDKFSNHSLSRPV